MSGVDTQAKKRQIDEILKDELPINHKKAKQSQQQQQQSQLINIYLNTVNKKVLDFDLEKICCVSLATINIYCCLTCGKFYQGRSKNSYAYNHAVDNSTHKLFINLDNLRVFVLPEGQEILNSDSTTLNDIRSLINPVHNAITVQHSLYDPNATKSYDLNRNQYKVGFLGLSRINNNSRNNFQSVVLQLFSHLHLIRDWYLVNTSPIALDNLKPVENLNAILDNALLKVKNNYNLNLKLGLFFRKYWYTKLFKTHIAPYDLLNFINKVSNGVFLDNTLDNNDPKFFLNWLLNNLNLGFKNKKSNILTKSIQGKIKVDDYDEEQNKITKSVVTNFWQISLQLPDKKILSTKNVSLIEQISLSQLLAAKFSKSSVITETISRKYSLLSLPNYLILNFDRFNKNFRHNFNDIVIKFDLESLDMSPYVANSSAQTLEYKLIANIVHDSINHQNDESSNSNKKKENELLFNANNHNWRIQLLDQLTNEWYEIDNLQVKKINKRLLFLSESYIQVWQRKSVKYEYNEKNFA